MPAPRRKNLLASRRRRRQDEGEEEESVLGDFEDDSLSEGSAVSNGDDEAEFEGSESSGDEREPAQPAAAAAKPVARQGRQESVPASSTKEAAKSKIDAFKPSVDTETMLHGVTPDHPAEEVEQLHFDDLPASTAGDMQPEIEPPKAPRNETPAQRARREHQEYIRQRNANPAFVPTRGGFFLHDDRNSSSTAPNIRPFGRGRGRAAGLPVTTVRVPAFNEPTDRPWAHDLHEEHENKVRQGQSQGKAPSPMQETAKDQAKVPHTPTAPNRSFSFSTVLGNVNVQVSFPGVPQKVSVPNVVKKHHTLLPQHRPPLRRDKPVRVSIPDTAPRYIFPSTDRSFIFIPRAMRPNQQGSGRGRGRGSFHGSRRPSIYGGGYTPSVAMSRKSSIGASTMREGIISPTESIMSRHIPGIVDGSRPVVRLPSAGPPPAMIHTPGLNGHLPMPMTGAPPMPMPLPVMYGSHSMAIPMHQPRPQKTVSVADIESPASFQFKAPQQQEEQPFHQQVPAHIASPFTDEKANPQPAQPNGPVIAGATPLSQIPEGAVFAPGFQPFPVVGPSYYGAPYHNGAVFYPPMPDAGSFGLQMGGAASAPSFVPGSQSHPVSYMPPPGPVDGNLGGNMMAHESNGMVYYYNPTPYPPGSQNGMQPFPMPPNGHMMPMANGGPAQPPFYYPPVPSAMFYPAQTG